MIHWLKKSVLALAGSAALVAAAPAQSPTAAQLDAFRQLTPEQQRTVMQAVGGGGAGARVEPPLATPQTAMPVAGAEPVGPSVPTRLGPGATVVLGVTLAPEVAAGDLADPRAQAMVSARRDRLLASNPYRLDDQGRIALPSTPPIPLGGLAIDEAARRLDADPRFAGLSFTVTLLPVQPSGSEALRPFGYHVFREVPTTYAPATDVPVPPDYAIGPGDTVLVTLFGKRTATYTLVVDREGTLTIPDLGPLPVAGLDFEGVRRLVDQRLEAQLIGVRASVTMGPLRSISVFVLGDVARPGAYTLSGLSTVMHALFTSGGVSEVGSLRKIELKRRGAVIARVDLYDLLLKGDNAGDRRLQSGDVVFVPPVGPTAGVAGRVLRPATYELHAGATVGDLLRLAGGLTADADPGTARLERIEAGRMRTVVDLDLSGATGRATRLMPGDVLTVERVLDDVQRSVSLEGEVARPGRYAWREGMRLTDLLVGLDALKLEADQRYVLIRRESMPERRVSVLSADARAAFAAPRSAADPLLQSRDRVLVLRLDRDRGAVLREVVDELRAQGRDNEPLPLVTIGGRVRAGGRYPLESSMRVSDLIRAGGGLDEAAYVLTAELTRLDVAASGRETRVEQLDLAAILAGDGSADRVLQPYDTLLIKEVPKWNAQGTIKLLGEVQFPGEYPIRNGETLSAVLARAGGLTRHAFAAGAAFTREEIRVQERQQLDALANRLQNDLASLAIQGSQTSDAKQGDRGAALEVGQSLLAQLRATRPAGRLVIDLSAAIDGPGTDDDVQLRDGDALFVPPLRQHVTVLGEVQSPGSQLWKRGLGRDDFIDQSGGLTRDADRGRIYVVRANGIVVPSGRLGKEGIRQGDTIVVPLDTTRMRPLPLWTAVTTIIYNLAVSVAAVGSL